MDLHARNHQNVLAGYFTYRNHPRDCRDSKTDSIVTATQRFIGLYYKLSTLIPAAIRKRDGKQ
jgi:hypothetical protein